MCTPTVKPGDLSILSPLPTEWSKKKLTDNIGDTKDMAGTAVNQPEDKTFSVSSV